MENTSYKTCAVSMCNNTTIRTPQKLFIPLPHKPRIRKHWLELAGKLPNAFNRTTSAYFCEDHFDLPNDMKNYRTYRATGKVSRILIRSGCLPSKFPGQQISSTSTDCQTFGTDWNKLDIKSEYEEEITSNISSKASETSTKENSYQTTIASDLTDFQTHTTEWSSIKVKSEFEEEITTGELILSENLNSKVPTAEKGCQLTLDSNSTDFCQPLAEEGGNLKLKMECEEVMSSENFSIKPSQDHQSVVCSKLVGVCQPIVLNINRPSVKCEVEEKKTASVFMLSDHIKTVLSEYEDKCNKEMELKKCDKAIQVNITHKFRSKSTQTKIQTRSSQTSPMRFSKKPVSTSSFNVKDLKPTFSHSSRKRKPTVLRSSGKRKL